MIFSRSGGSRSTPPPCIVGCRSLVKKSASAPLDDIAAGAACNGMSPFGRSIRDRLTRCPAAHAKHVREGAMGETYLRVNGRWCYLCHAVDQSGQLIGFRLTARRTASATRAFMRQASDTVRCYHSLTIVTDKAHSYAKVNGTRDQVRTTRSGTQRGSTSTAGSKAISQAPPDADARAPKPGHCQSHAERRRDIPSNSKRPLCGLRTRCRE